MRLIKIIFLLFLLSSCCKEIDTFEVASSGDEGKHPINIVPMSTVSDLNLPSFNQRGLAMHNAFTKLHSHSYFISNQSLINHFKNADSTIHANGIDFEKFILVPVQAEIRDIYLGRADFQLTSYLSHNSKELILQVNAKFKYCSSGLNSDYGIGEYRNWHILPRPPLGYEFKLIKNFSE